MRPRWILQTMVAVCVSWLSASHAEVWVVDVVPGAGDFTSIQAAVDAAQNGDVVVALPGTYPEFTVDGKALRIVGRAEGGERPLIGGVLIKNLAAAQEVTLRGFDFDFGGSGVSACLGPVVLEDNAFWDLNVSSSARVLVARSSIETFQCFSSTVHAWELDVTGGIYLTNSFLFLSGSNVQGTDGADGWGALLFEVPFCTDGGDGGPGLTLNNSICQAQYSVFDGGSGGAAGSWPGAGPCSPGDPAPDVVGTGLSTIPGVAHDLEISSPALEGEVLSLKIRGAPFEYAYVLFSPSTSPLWFPAWSGSLALTPGPFLFLGNLGATGELATTVPVSELGPGVAALRLILQGVFVDASGPDFVGSPTDVELLDAATFLVDCNHNGIDDAIDIATGTSLDLNENGQPDECDVTLIVPDAYPTIQAALDVAQHKDMILVRPGTYAGPGFHDVTLPAKDVIIRGEMGPASTVIDLSGATAYGFRVPPESPSTVRIEGLTLRNAVTIQSPIVLEGGVAIVDCVFESNRVVGAWPTTALGGALSFVPKAASVSPVARIERCTFLGNEGKGGGIYAEHPCHCIAGVTLRVMGCIFKDNDSTYPGGGLSTQEIDVEVRNCVFVGNQASDASAIRFNAETKHIDILGCTIQGNHGPGDALTLWGNSTIRNTIAWGNTSPGTAQFQTSVSCDVAWSTIQFGAAAFFGPVTLGPGMLTADPLFVNPAAGDVHLGPGSPCRDAGDPAYAALPGETDVDGEPRVFGPAIDHGADEDQP